MSFAFRSLEYLKYIRNAKGLHGTHSPFVYDFVEQVMRKQSNAGGEQLYAGVDRQSTAILQRIREYYKMEKVLNINAISDKTVNGTTDLLVLPPENPAGWLKDLERYQPLFADRTMVVAPCIHEDEQHLAAWQELGEQPDTRMTIDLFAFGLLLYRNAFKQRQHFVLRR